MSVGLYTHTTRATGTILTAAIYNADHQNHVSNQNPEMTGSLSDTLAEHQSMSDPGGIGSEVLAGSLADELLQLRFCIDRIVGGAQWYSAPPTNLTAFGGELATLDVAQWVRFKGDLSPAQITANQNNYAPTGHATTFRFILTSDADRDITGLVEGVGNTGRIVVIYNDGAFNLTLKNEDAASSAANRFSFGGNITIGPKQSLAMQYDSPDLRWRLFTSCFPTNLSPTLNGVRFPEVTPPGNPPANNVELYCFDDSGTSKMAYKDSAGTITVLEESIPPSEGITTIETGSLTGANIDINDIPETFAYLVLQVTGGSMDTSARQPLIRASVDNGSSFDATAGNYIGAVQDPTGGILSNSALASLGESINIAAANTFDITMVIHGYQTGPAKRYDTFILANGVRYFTSGVYVGSTNNIDALRILLSGSGNFDAGTYTLYGVH